MSPSMHVVVLFIAFHSNSSFVCISIASGKTFQCLYEIRSITANINQPHTLHWNAYLCRYVCASKMSPILITCWIADCIPSVCTYIPYYEIRPGPPHEHKTISCNCCWSSSSRISIYTYIHQFAIATARNYTERPAARAPYWPISRPYIILRYSWPMAICMHMVSYTSLPHVNIVPRPGDHIVRYFTPNWPRSPCTCSIWRFARLTNAQIYKVLDAKHARL